MKNNKKMLIVIIILVILLLIAVGFVYYQNEKYQDLSENYTAIEKENNINKQKLEEQNNALDSNKSSVDEQYAKFLENAKRTRETLFNEYSGQTLDKESRVFDDANYSFEIKSNGDLIMNIYGEHGASVKGTEKYKNYKLDTNVLLMELSDSGNGGYTNLWYLKEDGNVYVVSPDSAIAEKKEIEPKKEKYKYIVNIAPAGFGDAVGSGGRGPVFIDIEGNIHR